MDKQTVVDWVETLIDIHGNQAYHKAVLLTSLAVNLGDTDWAEHYAEVARELMQQGYHKFEKEN